MIALPKALQPWAAELALLSGDTLDGLASWLAPLRSLIGPMARPLASSLGDPDGFSGLSRRGSYERLLLSEWLLALEVPEEFLRRAAMGEHMFTQPAFVTPHGASRCLALLDCGPRQIGAPRLGQLAALIVLQARAEASQAQFEFAILGDETPPKSLHRQSIAWWSRASSWADGEDGLHEWHERLQDDSWDEVWICGASSLLSSEATRLEANLLTIDPTTHEGAPSLSLAVRARGQALREATLMLPPTKLGVRILRSPLGNARPFTPPAATVCEGSEHLSICGRRLFVSDGKGGFIGHHVPNTSRANAGRPKQAPMGYERRLLAVDLCERRMMLLAIGDDEQIWLEGTGLNGELSIGAPHVLPLEAPLEWRDDQGAFQMFIVRAEPPHFLAAILDPRQQLWKLEVDTDKSVLEPIDRSCHDAVRLGRHAVGWRSGSTGRLEVFGATIDLSAADHSRAHFAIEAPVNSWRRGEVRVAWAEFGQILISGLDSSTYDLAAPEHPLLGLDLSDQHNPRRPAVLYVKNEREVWRRRLQEPDALLFSRPLPFASIRHEPSGEKIVWRGSEGHVGVFCLRHDEEVLFLRAKSEGT